MRAKIIVVALALAVFFTLSYVAINYSAGDVDIPISENDCEDIAPDYIPATPTPEPEASHTFPTLRLVSELHPFEQEREYWHDGYASMSGAPFGQNFGRVPVRLRGRGNSTWWAGADKRPLRLRFNQAQNVLGSEYIARDWILLANHFDRSLLRNDAALTLGQSLSGLRWTPSFHHVHLYINNEYVGVYMLTDERDVIPGRMEHLVWDEDPAISSFFLELDARVSQTGIENETFIIVNERHYDLRWPRDLPEGHIDYARDYLTRISYAVRYGSYDEITALLDIDSFIDFFIVQEFFKDVDARNNLSIFMYITGTGENRRLFMGPIWDYDLAAGNAGHQWDPTPTGLYVGVFNYWTRYLLYRPEFFTAVQARWNEIRYEQIAYVIDRVQYMATYYQAEFERNFERHPNVFVYASMPVVPEVMEIDSFMGQVDYLVNWLSIRADWMTDFFNGHIPAPLGREVEYQAANTPLLFAIDGVFYGFTVPAFILDGIILAPICEIGLAFGVDVSHEITITGHFMVRDGLNVSTLPVGEVVVTFGDTELTFELPGAYLINDYVYVPLETVVDALGYYFYWHELARTIIISSEVLNESQ